MSKTDKFIYSSMSIVCFFFSMFFVWKATAILWSEPFSWLWLLRIICHVLALLLFVVPTSMITISLAKISWPTANDLDPSITSRSYLDALEDRYESILEMCPFCLGIAIVPNIFLLGWQYDVATVQSSMEFFHYRGAIESAAFTFFGTLLFTIICTWRAVDKARDASQIYDNYWYPRRQKW